MREAVHRGSTEEAVRGRGGSLVLRAGGGRGVPGVAALEENRGQQFPQVRELGGECGISLRPLAFECLADDVSKALGEPVGDRVVVKVFGPEEWFRVHYQDRAFRSSSGYWYGPDFVLQDRQRGELAIYDGQSFIEGFEIEDSVPDPRIGFAWTGAQLGLCPQVSTLEDPMRLELDLRTQAITRPLSRNTMTLAGIGEPVTFELPPEVTARGALTEVDVPAEGTLLIVFPASRWRDDEGTIDDRVVVVILSPVARRIRDSLVETLHG